MKARVQVILLSVAVLAAPAALAQTPYVGVSAGASKVEQTAFGLAELDESDTGWKVFGGYRFSPNLGVEGGWVDLGAPSSTEGVAAIETEIRGFYVDAVGVLPIGERWELFAKGGLFASKLDTKTVDNLVTPPVQRDLSEDSVDPTLGVGGAVNFKPISLRLELESFFVESTDVSYLLSLGVELRF